MQDRVDLDELEALLEKGDPPVDGFRISAEEEIIFTTLPAMIAELRGLRDIIGDFCYEYRWATDSWKAQPHVMALFDAVKKRGS